MKKLLPALALTGSLLLGPADLPAQNEPIAKDKKKFLGNIYSPNQVTDFAKYWNQVAPENAGKWGSVEATRDVMNWTALDAAYKLAKDHNFPFRMHVLVWGNQQPGWIETLSTTEQLEEIEEWFAAVAARYPAIDLLEVVNEPINDPPSQAGNGGGNYIMALGGTGTTQYDWIINAFKLARKHFPGTKLMINEYNLTNNATNTSRYSRIIDLLKAENLIDAIGIQGHAFSTRGFSAASINTNLGVLTAKGLPVYITEMDIDGLNDNTQLEEYKRVFPIFWDNPVIRGVTLWGWRPGLWRDAQGANLVRSDGSERPALTWLRQYVTTTVTGSKTEALPGLLLYPNPVTGNRLFLDGLERNSTVEVRDMLGNRVQKFKITVSGHQELALNLAPGVYSVCIQSGEKQAIRKIVIK